MGRKKQLYDIIHCSFFEKADKEGHLVVTLKGLALCSVPCALCLDTCLLSQHLVAVFLKRSSPSSVEPDAKAILI